MFAARYVKSELSCDRENSPVAVGILAAGGNSQGAFPRRHGM